MDLYNFPGGSRLCTALLCLCLGAAPATGQADPGAWQSYSADNGSLVFGTAHLPDHRLAFGCTAPSQQGLPLFQTGSHETHRTDPFQMYILFGDDLFAWRDPWRQSGVTLVVGGERHVLGDFQLNELQGTALYLPMVAPVIHAIHDAPSLSLITPEGLEHRFPVAGLATALNTAFSACIARWAEMGHMIPASVNRYRSALDDAAAPATPLPGIPVFNLSQEAASRTPAQGTSLPGVPVFDLSGGAEAMPSAPRATTIAQLPTVIPRQVREKCGGLARIEDSALTHSGDFDADGLPDYVINYTDVFCLPDDIRGFCGAANCSIEVFLSSIGYRTAFEFLAIALEPATASNGRTGLRMSATPSMCSGGTCDGIWVWDGQTFEMQ